MDKKKRIVFHLDTPYSAVAWPQISPKDQDTIVELLCSLLSPLGHYRSQHIHASKGNRAKKRKRKAQSIEEIILPIPPSPELQSYVDIGLSSVSRRLQKTVSKGLEAGLSQVCSGGDEDSAGCLYSVIFVARSGQPNALSSHLPQMVAVACKAHPSELPTRLVELPKACEGRLCEALGLPRVSCIGIRTGAPNSGVLVDFTREHTAVIEAPWLQEAIRAEYQPAKINAVETTIGPRKKLKDKNAK